MKMAAGAMLAPLADAMQEKPPAGVTDLLDGSAMVRIPAGEFQMGSADGNPDEQPVHPVRITRPFEIGKYEITQAQWEGVMRDAHMKPEVKTNFSNFQGLSLPVESVTWDDAQDFLKRLNARDPSHTYRLPTEAEWEYACRGGSGKGAKPKLDAEAWYEMNSQKLTHPAGTKQPDSLGLFDMLGNVAEWVQDWYGRDYYGQSPEADPQGPDSGSYRVYRGGGWFDPAKNLRAAYRGFDFPSNKVYNVGFRIVRTSNA
jgi:formylglycine-generating enzyme required for sulfatase activity